MEFHCASDASEARAMALRTNLALIGEVGVGVDQARFEEIIFLRVLVIVIGFLQHPREDSAVTSTGGTPTARGVEGEMFGIELRKRFAGFDIRACGGKPRQYL